jgi:hypothetical protein
MTYNGCIKTDDQNSNKVIKDFKQLPMHYIDNDPNKFKVLTMG